MSYSKIYVHRLTGLATVALGGNSPIGTLTSGLASTFTLDVVFHDGVSAVSLAVGSTGAFWCRPNGNYTGAVYFQATTMSLVSQSPGDGYRFRCTVAVLNENSTPTQVATDMGQSDSIPAMCGVVWSEDSDVTINSTGRIGMTIGNAGWNPSSPPAGPSTPPYPAAGQILTLAGDASALRFPGPAGTWWTLALITEGTGQTIQWTQV